MTQHYQPNHACTGHNEQQYQCQDCHAVMNETSIKGVLTRDGYYVMPCVRCNSTNIKLIQG